MPDQNKKSSPNFLVDTKKVDTKEFELPETVYISDIDAKVFQGIVLECLSQIRGVALAESGFMSHIFGKSPEVGCGIQSERDSRDHSVSIKIEVNILYGLSIPEKAEEIQTRVVEQITAFTGLRVSSVHIVFKNVISPAEENKMRTQKQTRSKMLATEEEYSEEFDA